MTIVGHCPHCGAPIDDVTSYGGTSVPTMRQIQYNCDCRNRLLKGRTFGPLPAGCFYDKTLYGGGYGPLLTKCFNEWQASQMQAMPLPKEPNTTEGVNP